MASSASSSAIRFLAAAELGQALGIGCEKTAESGLVRVGPTEG